MKKASLLMILVLVGILVLGASAVFAVPQEAIDNSAACAHAPVPATNNANLGSVVGSCAEGPPG